MVWNTGKIMEWTHLACLLAGTFVGSFLMTVWQNERAYRREREDEPIRISNVCWYPKATNPPPPPPPHRECTPQYNNHKIG